ncbi:MAG: SGNH/GDSL hydrolase family protein [Granulosicoccus sp.]
MHYFANAIQLTIVVTLLTACGGSQDTEPRPLNTEAEILSIGDSFFEWHAESKQSIPDEIGKLLGKSVSNQAMTGALITGGDGGIDIEDQYVEGGWEWVVLAGGGNDLNDKCSCNACEGVLDQLITEDANFGAIPELVARVLNNGHDVVYMSYPVLPTGAQFGFNQCADEFIELEFRVDQLAQRTQNMWLVSASDVVPEDDNSYFEDDLVHPSVKATAAIGEYIAQTINASH